MENIKRTGCALIAAFLFSWASAQDVLTVKVNEPKADVQSTMWGVFFEDINLGADGGIYAELVKNRSFEFFKPMMGWAVKGSRVKEGDILVENRKEESPANPRYIHVMVNNAAPGDIGIANEGFRGMGIKQGLRYDFSVMYRQQQANVKLHVELVDSAGAIIAGTTLDLTETATSWHKAAVSFNATATVLKAKMNIWFEGNGAVDLDMISLFPGDTWKNRHGGMRADMVQLLADMKPGFIRFPGGCIVEGFDLSQRYQWKKTIGPVESRQLIINRWNFEMAHRPAPDYFQTFGLGFFEYFQLAEDIGAQPLPVINCGMACQFNSAEVVPLGELDPYVQDALDLVEFANGDVNTKWGKIRADMGHPAPFNLKMIGVGNENWGPQYLERLSIFTNAIKAKYPAIKIVNSSGTDPVGDRFDYLNDSLRKRNADIIDEHYYRRPEWFFANAARYDNYPRTGAKVFAGEYAAQSDHTVSIDNKNNWLTALSEAAFMTGLERNADVVSMASYAPLFAHVDGWQWTPDLIWVNNLQSFGTPNYYVQKMFSTNRGNKVVPVTANSAAVEGQDSLYASAVKDTLTGELVVKIVNASARQRTNKLVLDGVKKTAAKALLTQLQSVTGGQEAVNSFENPANVSPQQQEVAVNGKQVSVSLPAYSFTVIRVKIW